MDAVAVIGLGYVGCVEAAVLSAAGRKVVGVDLREVVVAAIEAGRAPLGGAGPRGAHRPRQGARDPARNDGFSPRRSRRRAWP
jgi:glycine/D-amino acid oxidase-like deaminating enzyme